MSYLQLKPIYTEPNNNNMNAEKEEEGEEKPNGKTVYLDRICHLLIHLAGRLFVCMRLYSSSNLIVMICVRVQS